VAKKTVKNPKQIDAKLFWIGSSQAVRLPKEFRFEGDRVRVTRMGGGILREPVPQEIKETAEQLFARIDAMRGDALFPEGRKQNLARSVSISSELPARNECLHRAYQRTVSPDSPALLPDRLSPERSSGLFHCCP
jgi:antitoxin VapB